MHVTASRSWTISPSTYQRRLDCTAALLLFLLLAFMGSAFWPSITAQLGWLVFAFFLAVLFVGTYLWRGARHSDSAVWIMHYDEQGWWRDVGDGYWRPIRLHAGSVKRPELVIWQYGRWPWQRWLLRPDSFSSPAEFQQLRRLLYPEL